VITNPTIAYVLMLIGIYGLIYELANPGAIIPGVIGTIALLTALFAFQALPVNYAGLALLAVGIGFMALEAFVPSFGALGIGGAVAFVIGSLILYQRRHRPVRCRDPGDPDLHRAQRRHVHRCPGLRAEDPDTPGRQRRRGTAARGRGGRGGHAAGRPGTRPQRELAGALERRRCDGSTGADHRHRRPAPDRATG
jgi:membrane-bound serine protease (ClpP class)